MGILSIFKEKKIWSTLLTHDMHNHLLFGIDDGSDNIETTCQMGIKYVEMGYKKVTCTPHILHGFYSNSYDTIAPVADNTIRAFKEQGIDLEVRFAAEYYLDDYFVGLLRDKKPLLTLDDQQHVLVETAFLNRPNELIQVFFEMQVLGYIPVLAHPERYVYLYEDYALVDEFRNAGVKFQLNMLSLMGYYSKMAKKMCEYLVDKGYYEFLATDAHSVKHLDIIHKGIQKGYFKKVDLDQVLNR
jgi:protein-tyrosine phosphatase